MRNICLTVLLFACFASTLAYEEFFDSRGKCWRCYPGKPCEECPRFSNHIWPVGWSDMCFEPNCNVPENRRFLFPSRESDRYFRCVYNHNHWTHETVSCRCGTVFNMRTQECVGPRNWTPYCVELVTPIMMRSCESGLRIPMIGNEPEPRPEDNAPSTWVTNTWTPDPELTTTTTPTNGETTTEDNCQCIPWWPCWCRPVCIVMPCMG